MKSPSPTLSLVLTLCLAAPLAAQDPEPGSVLVYPSLRGTLGRATVVSVTNTNPTTTIAVRFSYVNMVATPDPFMPADCLVADRFELLTPHDTLTLAVFCHNPAFPTPDGYLVIAAVTPATAQPVSFDYLIGSEFVVAGASAAYSLAAVSFQSPQPDGVFTDFDGDGELDFDGVEYTMCPEELYIDTFLASIGNNLALIGLTGGTMFTTTVRFTVFNDNEQPFSATRDFRCWFDQPLDTISPVFTSAFLSTTAHDPAEFDVDCDGAGDLETGWVIVRGSVARSISSPQVIPDPALLGAVTGSIGLERGRPLWRRGDNVNGDFLGTAPLHPEFP